MEEKRAKEYTGSNPGLPELPEVSIFAQHGALVFSHMGPLANTTMEEYQAKNRLTIDTR